MSEKRENAEKRSQHGKEQKSAPAEQRRRNIEQQAAGRRNRTIYVGINTLAERRGRYLEAASKAMEPPKPSVVVRTPKPLGWSPSDDDEPEPELEPEPMPRKSCLHRGELFIKSTSAKKVVLSVPEEDKDTAEEAEETTDDEADYDANDEATADETDDGPADQMAKCSFNCF